MFLFHFTLQCSMFIQHRFAYKAIIKIVIANKKSKNAKCERIEKLRERKIVQKKKLIFLQKRPYTNRMVALQFTWMDHFKRFCEFQWKLWWFSFHSFPICGFNHFVHLKRNQICLLVVVGTVQCECTRKQHQTHTNKGKKDLWDRNMYSLTISFFRLHQLIWCESEQWTMGIFFLHRLNNSTYNALLSNKNEMDNEWNAWQKIIK